MGRAREVLEEGGGQKSEGVTCVSIDMGGAVWFGVELM